MITNISVCAINSDNISVQLDLDNKRHSPVTEPIQKLLAGQQKSIAAGIENLEDGAVVYLTSRERQRIQVFTQEIYQ